MLVATTIFLTFLSTLAGGLFALHFKGNRTLISAFGAGAILGVSFFDLLPESLSMAAAQIDTVYILVFAALGFTIYMLLDRYSLLHAEPANLQQQNIRRGVFGAGSLSLHSFFDGITIGLAAQVSVSMAVVVAIGVIAHDFSDGINTVIMIVKNNGAKKRAFKWLLTDSFAPVAGIVSTYFFKIPRLYFAAILALFAGFFFYLGANALTAENKYEHPLLNMAFTVLGMATIFFAVQLTTF